MSDLPTISAICLTYGRTHLLEEAIQCFLDQKCDCETELIVLNTCVHQKLELKDCRKNVHVFNCDVRPTSVGDARNKAVSLASGKWCVIHDDDDLYLPNHYQNFSNHFDGNDWLWMSAQFYSLGNDIKEITGGGQNVVAFTKDAWARVGRYADLNCGEDRDFVGRLTKACKGSKIELAPEEVSFVYRWGMGNFHVSGLGDDEKQKVNAWKRSEIDFLNRVRLRKEKVGKIVLTPHLKRDYVKMAYDFTHKASKLNKPAISQDAVSCAQDGPTAIFHCVERHSIKDAVELARKRHAWESWNVLYKYHGVIPKHYSEYSRSALGIGDNLDLPYLKDVLACGMKDAGLDDIIVWTNDDTVLHPSVCKVLREHLKTYPAVSSHRCEFKVRPPSLRYTPEQWARANVNKAHNGRDLFAFKKSWLVQHWDEIPDFILGASEFDVFLTVMIRNGYAIENPRAGLDKVIPPAEIPRGYVGHVHHAAKWNLRQRYGNAAAQKHNIELYRKGYALMVQGFQCESVSISRMINLPSVTLWACCWSLDEELNRKTLRVLAYCKRIARFNRILFFSCFDCRVPFGIELVKIKAFSGIQDWNEFVNKAVRLYIDSDHAMSVHEDGFPVRLNQWTDDFLKYDYIGAPWRDGVVGNGGFNIESKRLLDAKLALETSDVRTTASDYWVCRNHRKEFAELGIKFAPKEIAAKFSEETVRSENAFGFHGRNYNPEKYAMGWNIIKRFEALEKKFRVLPIEGSGIDQIAEAKKFEATPSVCLIYIFSPQTKTGRQDAKRFVESYKANPPEYPHRTVIVCNGDGYGDVDLFNSIPLATFYKHSNVGWDIGGYVAASRDVKENAVLCLGSASHFKKPGWMRRFVEAWSRHGVGMYGSLASYAVRPHLNSTGFMCPPRFLRAYPLPVASRVERYEFEHGTNSLWLTAYRAGFPVKLVTWDGEYDPENWRTPGNIYFRGDQSNCITYWSGTDKYDNASPVERVKMAKSADTSSDPDWTFLFGMRCSNTALCI